MIVTEALRSTYRRPMSTFAVALMLIVMTCLSVYTLGRAESARDDIQDRLENAGSRRIQFVDRQGVGLLTPAAFNLIQSLSAVDRVLGLSLPIDVRNGEVGLGAEPVPLWLLRGDWQDAVILESGRFPRPGEIIVGEDVLPRLGLTHGSGFVTGGGSDWSVVGTFRGAAPYFEFDNGALGMACTSCNSASFDVLVDDAGLVADVTSTVLRMVDPSGGKGTGVSSSATLAMAQVEVGEQLVAHNRRLATALTFGGAVLISVLCTLDALLQRLDIGRRRALGASRFDVGIIVLLRFAFSGLIGGLVAVLLCLTGVVLGIIDSSAGYILSAAAFNVVIVMLACVIPAVAASYQDPVRVLRSA